MSATLIITLKVTDEAALTEYRKHGGAAVVKHGGSPTVVGPVGETLYGTPLELDSIVVLSFPDLTAAKAWLEDPELVDLHAMRNKGADCTITVVG